MKFGLSQAPIAWPPRDPLFWCGAILLAIAPLLAGAAMLDERALFGRSPWDKPLRFALSLGVYAVSMAWASQWLLARTRVPGWRWLSLQRVKRAACSTKGKPTVVAVVPEGRM